MAIELTIDTSCMIVDVNGTCRRVRGDDDGTVGPDEWSDACPDSSKLTIHGGSTEPVGARCASARPVQRVRLPIRALRTCWILEVRIPFPEESM